VGSGTEVVASPEHDRRLHRRFSAEDKQRILAEAESCSERGALAALLRRERLYSSQLAAWRVQLEREGEAGLVPKKPGRKILKDAKDRRIEALERDKAILTRKLLIAEKLLELQKKAQELLAATESEHVP
jgi:transposase